VVGKMEFTPEEDQAVWSGAKLSQSWKVFS